ncbi:hypothetical protein [Roseicyclus marinus]|uniref:Uncharacterized protein n=1 Tax=Roseicyclus marinus TaxID=2161673 RepID=A0AA48KK59_9RHOB|nr:hypothetical protein MACH21_30410 [Roseicyclus marinus]
MRFDPGLALGCLGAVALMAILIVEMPTVPVALAGADFGWPGLVGCLAVALVMRWQIGGIGRIPDAVRLGLAEGVGWVGARIARADGRRGLCARPALARADVGTPCIGGAAPRAAGGVEADLPRAPAFIVCPVAVSRLARLREGAGPVPACRAWLQWARGKVI